MQKKLHGLTSREKQFCGFYVNSGNVKEAAICAGYTQPEKAGSTLLLRDDINEEIERLFRRKTKNFRQRACAGYERLAFGNVSDAVRLMLSENPLDENLDKYDLFNVAEIKRPKDGAMEIKFFDRIKALEKLENAESVEEKSGSAFYRALLGGLDNKNSNIIEEEEQ